MCVCAFEVESSSQHKSHTCVVFGSRSTQFKFQHTFPILIIIFFFQNKTQASEEKKKLNILRSKKKRTSWWHFDCCLFISLFWYGLFIKLYLFGFLFFHFDEKFALGDCVAYFWILNGNNKINKTINRIELKFRPRYNWAHSLKLRQSLDGFILRKHLFFPLVICLEMNWNVDICSVCAWPFKKKEERRARELDCKFFLTFSFVLCTHKTVCVCISLIVLFFIPSFTHTQTHINFIISLSIVHAPTFISFFSLFEFISDCYSEAMI